MSAEPPVIGWDLGGAHLKAARVEKDGVVTAALQLASPLWQGLEHLDSAMTETLERLGPANLHAVTMTGEMTDLFGSRAEGVRAILDRTRAALPQDRIAVFAGGSGFLDFADARERPLEVASANWLASASLAARKLTDGMLVDIGSTTTDIVPFEGGRILAQGTNDHERLAHDELVYTGIARTPVMAVTDHVLFEGMRQAIMAELFATMADVHRINGTLPDDADQMPTADGRGKSVEESARRLARMLGRDFEDHDMTAWARLAAHLVGIQTQRVEASCRRVLARGALAWGTPFIGAGCGRFLVRDIAKRLHRPYLDFADLMPVERDASYSAGSMAPAVSVACLSLLT